MTLKKLTSEAELYAFISLFVKACEVFKHVTVHRLAHDYFATLLQNTNYEIWLLYDEDTLVGFMDLADSRSPVMPFRRTRCQFMYVEPTHSAARLMLQLRRFAYAHDADSIEVMCKIGFETQWQQHGFQITSLTLKGPHTWEKLLLT